MFHFDVSIGLHNSAKELFGVAVPQHKFFILYLLTSLGMAWLVWRAETPASERKAKKFFSAIFHPGVYNHKSSWQDYFVFLINGLLYYGIVAQFILSEKSVSVFVLRELSATFGIPTHPMLAGITAITLYTLVAALLLDLSIYCAHYMLHKTPHLWAFHKVHHSAEVMTPVTVLRIHPVELLLNSLAYAVFLGFGIGIFSYLAIQDMTEARIFGLNVIVFAAFIIGVHLRHSHVWLHYPTWLSHILLSPAQHQIHHSTQPRHFDRNLALIFSFWDKIFGTLYVPKKREELEFGIHKRERNPYRSVREMYLQPFRECYALIRKGELK